jgi:hypothetical protein
VHFPATQASGVVQALPSSHAAAFNLYTHPIDALQESSVHGFPSSQTRLPAGLHVPSEQTSPVVHALLSVQLAVLFACLQPEDGLHESVVHGFPS